MELNKREIELIKLALNERAKSNEKILNSLQDLGIQVENDDVCKQYLSEVHEINSLFRKISLMERYEPMNRFDKRLIETWYFTESVEGISTINDFLHCDAEIHGSTTFSEWLQEQELEDDFREWLVKNQILDSYK